MTTKTEKIKDVESMAAVPDPGAWTFKAWYDSNSQSFNKDRRKRYDTDPEYRARVLETNRLSRQRRREAAKLERAAESAAIKVKMPHKPWKEVEVPTKGGEETTKLYSIGALARALNRSVQVIRLWEKKGVIPETPLRNDKGDRLYTPEDVSRIHELLKAQNRLDDKPRPQHKTLLAKIRLSDGSVIECPVFRVGIFAQAIGRSVVTLEQMERRKVIPPSPLRTPAGHRVYTASMIEVVKHALDKRGPEIRGEQAWQEFAAEVKTGWKTAKVNKSKLLDVRTEMDDAGDEGEADGEVPEGEDGG